MSDICNFCGVDHAEYFKDAKKGDKMYVEHDRFGGGSDYCISQVTRRNPRGSFSTTGGGKYYPNDRSIHAINETSIGKINMLNRRKDFNHMLYVLHGQKGMSDEFIEAYYPGIEAEYKRILGIGKDGAK
jgi:hypothetical protein